LHIQEKDPLGWSSSICITIFLWKYGIYQVFSLYLVLKQVFNGDKATIIYDCLR